MAQFRQSAQATVAWAVMLLYLAERAVTFVVGNISVLLLSPSSSFSIASLLSALCIAITFLVLTRRRGKKPVRYKVMFRALFPRWVRLPSFKADVWFLLFNVFAFGLLFGWTVLSSKFIGAAVAGALNNVVGVAPSISVNPLASRTIATVALFLAYELAYWVDHYLSHRVAFLWEFHKVHHTAEVLSPLTNFRVHPIDTVVFHNLVALFLGTTSGVLRYLHFGDPFVVDGVNAILVIFVFLTVHLQHSHVWIPATGLFGRIIVSPAHHQIHHSDNPIHFDKNFGSCLSIWDWLFGTLHMPERQRERLSFGIATRAASHHTATGGLLMPFVLAWRRLRPSAAKVASAHSATAPAAVMERHDATQGV